MLAAEDQLQLTVSIGCARNKLLAKLSSQAAKPNGLHAVETPQVQCKVLHELFSMEIVLEAIHKSAVLLIDQSGQDCEMEE